MWDRANKIREDVTELLDVTPAKFFVQKHIYPQYACRSCETIEAVPVAPAIIDGGMATPGILAWLLVGKHVDHLPLYRMEQIAARSGVSLARSTLAEWVGRTGVALAPLADRLRELLLERTILHADETPVAQLDPGKGKTKRAYLWAYCSHSWDTGPPILVFDYQGGRSGDHAKKFLNGWTGHLMVDDYGGYKALFQSGVIELGCMAHARRKFFDLNAAQSTALTTQVLNWIGKLYEIERIGQDMSIEERLVLRREQSIPVLEKFHLWLIAQRRVVADGSGAARTIEYSLRRWEALARYATQGDLPIDNNRIENGIRPIAIGKNYAQPCIVGYPAKTGRRCGFFGRRPCIISKTIQELEQRVRGFIARVLFPSGLTAADAAQRAVCQPFPARKSCQTSIFRHGGSPM